MTPSPLVSVEGQLARPRVAPLDGVPPFGREWTFRGVAGDRPGERCVATLTTSCIDVDAPHRMCRWQPLSATRSSSADLPATPAVLRRPGHGPYPRPHGRRAIDAACWSVGALGIIGWLIVAHEPLTGFTAAPALHATRVIDEPATQATGVVRVAAAPPLAPAQNATPVATPARTSPPHDTASDPQRVADASIPSPHRPAGARTTAAPVRAPGASPAASPAASSRLAARPPVTHLASRTPILDRVAPPSLPGGTHRDPLDNPLALIALANALDAERPARAANAPAAGFDWTAQLSHRRLTEASATAPDTFTR
ncbi:hypothetical protein [Burkholderia sp. IMCC1007]|uniref:hypothetical protein n=1 Tax=Burkholderia sp. IMCC1007 TaxID=3004104 RepID=UPI0022B2F4BD|nr:hypothetical protein [Burkholderia sp. IMCC1007]